VQTRTLCPVLIGRDDELAVLTGALRSARDGTGRAVLVAGDAGIGGTHLAVGYGGKLHVPLATIVANELTIVGNLVGTHAELEELVGLAASGAVTARTHPYPLAYINEAVDDLRNGRLLGRAVLLPG
jgi:Zn-dependent alcohol dehydrogenase